MRGEAKGVYFVDVKVKSDFSSRRSSHAAREGALDRWSDRGVYFLYFLRLHTRSKFCLAGEVCGGPETHSSYLQDYRLLWGIAFC